MSTTTYVALLRGVNVGGKTVGMAPLRVGLEAIGFADVRTYLQSGNVVFTAEQADPSALAALVRERIAADSGHEVGVLVLTAPEMSAIAAANPFLDAVAAGEFDQGHLHATFLFQQPDGDTFARLDLPAAPGEQALLHGRVAYLHLPHGYGHTKLTNAYFERKLGPATTRNWRTVGALVQMSAGR